MPESGHVDRQLGAQHARSHLGDLAGPALLLLATGAIGHQTIVWLPRRVCRLGPPTSHRDAGATIPAVGWGLYAVGWSLGWLLLWSTRRLPPPTDRPAVAVVVPARDEAGSLPALLAALRPQLREGDELVVVDDHSSDATAASGSPAGPS